jgi:general stress protein 26
VNTDGRLKMPELREQIIEYVERCRLCTIATVGADGQPSASTVFFKNAGLDIYFNTDKASQKVQNILSNPRVAIVMQEAGPAPKTDRDIKGIQCIGKARILSDHEIGEAPEAVRARHHVFNRGESGTSLIIKVTPMKIYLIDYSRGFRHRDLLEF